MGIENSKIALVTGASRGIGRAIAKRLAADGNYVVVNYSGSQDKAMETLSEIESDGGCGEVLQFDVADEKACNDAIADIISRHGRIDVLVNNAGITKDKLLMALSDDDFKKVVDVNLVGCFHMMRGVLKVMLRQKCGKIINIASVSGILGNAGQANYSASKAGIIGMTKSAAREYATKGININAVAPGFISTDMTDAMPQKAIEAGLQGIPMNRIGQPEEIAAAVSFLAGGDSNYITGQVLCVDGGMAM